MLCKQNINFLTLKLYWNYIYIIKLREAAKKSSFLPHWSETYIIIHIYNIYADLVYGNVVLESLKMAFMDKNVILDKMHET